MPGVAVLEPVGTWSFRHSGTLSGCTVTFSPETSTGTLDGDPGQGRIVVDTDTPRLMVRDPDGNEIVLVSGSRSP